MLDGFRFHHVGIGTTDFDSAIATYEALGYRLCANCDDEALGVRVAFLRSDSIGAPLVEVLAPLGDQSPLEPLIRRRAIPGPYHTCYEVASHIEATAALAKRGFTVAVEPTPAIALDDALVAFFYHASIGLVEIVEDPPPLG